MGVRGSFPVGVKIFWARFLKYLPFLYEVVKREFKSKYKRSVLGIVWSVLNPMLTMLILALVFSALFNSIENFPSYLFNAQIIFGLFSEATTGCMTSIHSGGGMILRTSVPKYMFPLSKCLVALVNQGLAMVAAVIIMLITGVQPSWTMLLFVFPVGYTLLFSLGIGLILATGLMYFEDLQHLYGIITTALMYLTPMFYPIEIVPEFMLPVYACNPIYHFVRMMRNVMMYQTPPTLQDHLICLAFCVGTLAIGVSLFKKKQNEFVLLM